MPTSDEAAPMEPSERSSLGMGNLMRPGCFQLRFHKTRPCVSLYGFWRRASSSISALAASCMPHTACVASCWSAAYRLLHLLIWPQRLHG